MKGFMRVVCIVVILAVMASTVAAGGQKEAENKIVVWSMEPADVGLRSYAETYMADNPGVTVEVVSVPWDNIHSKLTATIEAGSGGPDICTVEGYLLPNYVGPGIIDLTDRVKPLVDQIVPARLEAVTFDDHIWGIPTDCPPSLLIYRADIFEEAGVTEIPETWDEYLSVVGEKIINSGDRYLFGMDGEHSPTFYWWRPLASQLDSGYFTADGEIAIDSPESQRVTQWMADAVQGGYTLTGVDYWESPAWWSALKDNKVASAIAASWMMGMMKDEIPEQSGLWRAVPMPVWEKGNPRTTILGGAAMVIPTQANNPEGAWDFIQKAYFTVEGNLAIYDATGVWPSHLPSLQEPVFDTKDEYFGNTSVNRMMIELLPEANNTTFRKGFSEVDHNAVRPQIYKIFNGEISVEEGSAQMRKATESILSN